MKETGDAIGVLSEDVDWGGRDSGYAELAFIISPFYIIASPFTFVSDTVLLPADLIACKSFRNKCEFWDNVLTDKDFKYILNECRERFQTKYIVRYICDKCVLEKDIPEKAYITLTQLLLESCEGDMWLIESRNNLILFLAERPQFADLAKELIIQSIKNNRNHCSVRELAKKDNLRPYIYFSLLDNGIVEEIASSPFLPLEVVREIINDSKYCGGWSKLALNCLMTDEMRQQLRSNASKLLASVKLNQLPYDKAISTKRTVSHIIQLEFWQPIFTSGKVIKPYKFYKSHFSEDTLCFIHDIDRVEKYSTEIANLVFDLSLQLLKQQKLTYYYYFPSIVQKLANNHNIDIALFKKIFELNGSYYTTPE